MSKIHWLIIIGTLPALSCSGGGDSSDSTTPPPVANSTPSFTSAGTTRVDENTVGAFYTATASDRDGDAIIFSISGGPDSALFTIDSNNGALRFSTSPDFEAPTDANSDNIYDIVLRASDGRASVDLSLEIAVDDLSNTYQLRRVGTGFNQPLFLTGTGDSSGGVFVVEKGGLIRILNPDTGITQSAPFLDASNQISTAGEGGLLGLTISPDYATSGIFYVYVTNLSGDTEVRRYSTLSASPDMADSTSADVILTFPQPADNHNGGWIDFGPDGYLYVATGDGGGAGDPFAHGQNPNTLLAAMLRIDPAGDDFPGDDLRDYAIPPTNPFAGGGGAPEVFAYGLRNPFRSSFDSLTGDLYIGDVGQGDLEEIDLIAPGEGGLNFGWPNLEGTQPENGAGSPAFTSPVAEYPHGSGDLQGNSITGGYVYRGSIASLQGHYIFGDFISANIWSIPTPVLQANKASGSTSQNTAFTVLNTDFTPDVGTYQNISSFGTDDLQNLYVIDFAGAIYRVEPEN